MWMPVGVFESEDAAMEALWREGVYLPSYEGAAPEGNDEFAPDILYVFDSAAKVEKRLWTAKTPRSSMIT